MEVAGCCTESGPPVAGLTAINQSQVSCPVGAPSINLSYDKNAAYVYNLRVFSIRAINHYVDEPLDYKYAANTERMKWQKFVKALPGIAAGWVVPVVGVGMWAELFSRYSHMSTHVKALHLLCCCDKLPMKKDAGRDAFFEFCIGGHSYSRVYKNGDTDADDMNRDLR